MSAYCLQSRWCTILSLLYNIVDMNTKIFIWNLIYIYWSRKWFLLYPLIIFFYEFLKFKKRKSQTPVLKPIYVDQIKHKNLGVHVDQ